MSRQMNNLMKLWQPASSVPPPAPDQSVAMPEDSSQCHKRMLEAPPSTPPAAKRPTLEHTVEEPIYATLLSSAPPTSKEVDITVPSTTASTPPANPQCSIIVFTPPS